MATAKVNYELSLTLATGQVLQVGDHTEANSLSVTGAAYDVTKVVADAYNVETLWESGDGGITTFDLMVLVSDKTLLVEIRNDDGGEFTVLPLQANVPLIIGGSTTATDSSALFTDESETTGLDNVDKIEVQRNVADGQGDANVRLILVD